MTPLSFARYREFLKGDARHSLATDALADVIAELRSLAAAIVDVWATSAVRPGGDDDLAVRSGGDVDGPDDDLTDSAETLAAELNIPLGEALRLATLSKQHEQVPR